MANNNGNNNTILPCHVASMTTNSTFGMNEFVNRAETMRQHQIMSAAASDWWQFWNRDGSGARRCNINDPANEVDDVTQTANSRRATDSPPSRHSTPRLAGNETMTFGDVDTKAVNEMLSKELATLSFNDRNAINEEVHGVRNLAAEETPEMLRKSLMAFQCQLEKFHPKLAYDQAVFLFQSQWILYNPTLRLRCLRTERFNVSAAVLRFVKYLDLLLEYYGTEALLRPIRMSDLGKEETELLRSGEYQLLPFRDRSGRRVISCVGNVGLKFSLYARMKFFIYLWWVAAEDVETQQRGVISLFWPENHSLFPDKREAQEAQRVFGAIPTRIAAYHQCLPDTAFFRFTRAVVILSVDVVSRTRLKFHYNDDIETNYQLMTYGIPVDLIPRTGTGKIKLKNHQQWIRTRKVIEETKEDDPVECPGIHDVLFRFGKSYLSHPGNATFRELIEANFDEHNETTNTDTKMAVTWRIVEDIESRKGRFLVWDQRGWWKVTTDRAHIRSKVAVSLKEHKKRVQAKKNIQCTLSSTYQFERQDGGKRKRAEDGSEPSKSFCA
ncbi:hypothetical protein IV203_012436 [Nitzschia inconspicua]|uniref:DUF6824 domain-containing protein n=1 Tax=Nitzschia inconspicua TaxID=303405 RepID=A0A9K3KUZ3_9STRA|nr:hypothetical protein IV203_012436 [Nitzschia inconspicua]